MAQSGHSLLARRFSRGVFGLLAALGGFAPARSGAETLQNAIDRALQYNPALNAQRASAQGVHERLTEARSGYMPKVSLGLQTGYDQLSGQSVSTSVLSSPYRISPLTLALQAKQSLYDGGHTAGALDQARAQIRGADQTVRGTEQATILAAAAAYIAVVESEDLLRLNQSNVAFWSEQIRTLSERHSFGDVAKSDVAQARSESERTKLQASAAQATLEAARANYEQITGGAPVHAAAPPTLDSLVPASLGAALAAAEENPTIVAARAAADAARAQVVITKSDARPQLDVVGSIGPHSDWQAIPRSQVAGSAYLQLTVPIFDGGATSASAREAKAQETQRDLETEGARQQVRADVLTNWSNFQAAKAKFVTASARLRAAESAFADIGEAYWLGGRTFEEYLSAERDLFDARSAWIAAQGDRVATAFLTARAIGSLTAARVDAEFGRLGAQRRGGAEISYAFHVKVASLAQLAACDVGCAVNTSLWGLKADQPDAPLAAATGAEPTAGDPLTNAGPPNLRP